jgi:hypothetical protein
MLYAPQTPNRTPQHPARRPQTPHRGPPGRLLQVTQFGSYRKIEVGDEFAEAGVGQSGETGGRSTSRTGAPSPFSRRSAARVPVGRPRWTGRRHVEAEILARCELDEESQAAAWLYACCCEDRLPAQQLPVGSATRASRRLSPRVGLVASRAIGRKPATSAGGPGWRGDLMGVRSRPHRSEKPCS